MTDQPSRYNALKVCPHLGQRDDPATIYQYPTGGNFCHAVQPPSAVQIEHQENYCLSDRHVTCPLFTGRATPAGLQHIVMPAQPPPLPGMTRWVSVAALVAVVVVVWVMFRWLVLASGANRPDVVGATDGPNIHQGSVLGLETSPLATHVYATHPPAGVAGGERTPSPATAEVAVATEQIASRPVLTPTAALTPPVAPPLPEATLPATPLPTPSPVTLPATPLPTVLPAGRARPLEGIVLNVRQGPGVFFPLLEQITTATDALVVTGRDPGGPGCKFVA